MNGAQTFEYFWRRNALAGVGKRRRHLVPKLIFNS